MGADAVTTKQQLVNQLNTKAAGFLEAWKQDARRARAQILGNRQRMLDDLTFNHHQLRATGINDAPKTIESQYQICLAQLRQRAGTEIVENWREKAAEERRLIFAAHHQVCVDITKKATRKSLKSQPQSRTQIKAAVLKDLNKQAVPEWKEKEAKQRREAYEQRAQVTCDVREKKAVLKPTKNAMVQRSRVMEQIRAGNPVESWKQTIRQEIAVPKMCKHLLLNEVASQNFKLKSTKNSRDQVLAAIRRKDSMVEAWKEAACEQRKCALRGMLLTCAEIREKTVCLKKIPQHAQVMQQIRAAQTPTGLTVVESWVERERAVRSAAMRAKHACLIKITENTTVLKHSAGKSRQAVLAAIRAEPVPAWKEKVNAQRTGAIEAKRNVGDQITRGDYKLKNSTPMVQQKQLVMRQLRAAPVEGWKEIALNQRSMQLGRKHLLHLQFRNNRGTLLKSLKSTQTVEDNKKALLAQVRSTEPLPSWIETERSMRADAMNNRCRVLSTLSQAPTLKQTKSLEATKIDVLAEIRRDRAPLESWKEQERREISSIFSQKKTLMGSIEALKKGKVGLRNMQKQADLKEVAMGEIRYALGQVVPLWKERSMAKRCQVIKNKVELNMAIAARGTH